MSSPPPRRHERAMSPLRSPTLRRHLMSEDIDIHYPAQFLHERPVYKQSLIGEDGYFRTALDVHDFEPNEITVKTVGHTILVTCAHDEKEDDHGAITRNFSRKYVLPLDMDVHAIESNSSKGVLYIKVPPKTPEEPQVRVVDIKIE